MDDADAALAAEQEVKNPFPTPPVYWTRYTPENLRLLGLLKSKLGESGNLETIKEDESIDQASLLPDEPLLPLFPLLELEPPRLDWIQEQPEYWTFGEPHPANDVGQVFPLGIEKLYDPEPGADPRPPLRQLLVSLLLAYHKFLADILEPVPSGYHRPTEPPAFNPDDPNGPVPNTQLNWEATVLWMRTLVLNMGWAINEFRPVQARMTLESMMQTQIEVRREETRAIHAKCDDLERMLADLRSKTATLLPAESTVTAVEEDVTMHEGPAAAAKETHVNHNTAFPILDVDDLMLWSKEIPLT